MLKWYYLVPIFIGVYLLNCLVHIFRYAYRKTFQFLFAPLLILGLLIVFEKLNLLEFSFSIGHWYIRINLNYPLFNHTIFIAGVSFLILHKIFYNLWYRIFSIERERKLKQFAYALQTNIKERIALFDLSSKTMLILNVIFTTTTLILTCTGLLKYDAFPIRYDNLLLVNITIFALILPISVAIVSSNEYAKVTKYYQEALFSGSNLAFFIGYLMLIIANTLFKHKVIYVFTLSMVIMSFIFIRNLTFVLAPQAIIERINRRIFNKFSKGELKINVKSNESKFSWDYIKGTSFTVKTVDKYKDLEYAFSLLEKMGYYSWERHDKETFRYIIRNYFEIGRKYLYYDAKKNSEFVGAYLYPILLIFDKIKNDEDYRSICIEEIFLDYRNEEAVPLDMKVWNWQRFELMLGILQRIYNEAGMKEFVIARLIQMLNIRMMETRIVLKADFDNGIYKDFQKTAEFEKLKKNVHKYKPNWSQVQNNLTFYRFEDKIQNEMYKNNASKILIALKSKT